MLEATLRRRGARTGLYTSPHLVSPTERIRIDGLPVSEDEFALAFAQIHSTSENLLAHGEIDMHPTYFETVTSMAYLLFRSHRVDTVVLETGMGGRLDATNVVDPALAVITRIDFDHEKYLGDTLPAIAAEKAGIIKPGRPVVISRQHASALAVIEQFAAHLDSEIVRASDWRVDHLDLHPYGSRFHAVGPDTEIKVDLPLIGAHQVENALTSIAALDHLGCTPAEIQRGLAATVWPGRIERVRSSPDLLLDGAHNPSGARALAGYLRHFHPARRIWMVFAAMRDKDLRSIGPTLFPLASELIFTAPDQARAFRPEEIRELSGETRARLAPTVREALHLADAAAPDDLVVITGSLYLVGEARALLVP
jgi:dihydrofolate synthase/folylpolyglutamate synthase